VLIVPVDAGGKRNDDFSEDWEILFTTDRIRTNANSCLPLRTTVTFDAIKNSYKVQQTILKKWPALKTGKTDWFKADKGNKTTFRFDELPFFYMDAQRDILEDTKLRSSYLGKMLSKIEYSDTKKTNSVSPCRDIPWRNYPGYHYNKSSNPCLGHEFF
jgi:putative ATP-dependent endonuclease of OLD family